MTTTPAAPVLIAAPEVARRLNVSAETVRRWTREGKVAHVRLPSGKVRFREEDIAELLEPTMPEVAS